MKRPSPLDAPRDFRINEMFFSTTDRKGVILSGNDVFVRVSGYERERLLGTAHNIIRHPAMPRAVFQLVWDYLQRRQPVAGLVKNLASDGRYYWVVAFLMPIDDGYLSIRFKPSSGLLPVVEKLYAAMCDAERASVAVGQDGKAAMQAGGEVFRSTLRGQGFATYDDFMRVLLHDELKSRDAALGLHRLKLFPDHLPCVDPQDRGCACLATIHANGLKSYEQINTLYAELDRFAQLNRELAHTSEAVLGLTKDFRFIAFNAALRSARLGEEGRSLSVIADYLSTASDNTTKAVGNLMSRIEGVSVRLSGVIFDLAAARLQIEMVLVFCAELAAERGAGLADQRKMIEDLRGAFAGTVTRAMQTLEELAHDLRALMEISEEMRRLVLTLQVAQVGGLVEACRLKDDDSFAVMFAELRQGVARTKEALAEVDDASGQLTALATRAPAIAASVSTAVREMSQSIEALSMVAVSSVKKQTTAVPAKEMAEQLQPAEFEFAAG